MQLAPPSMVVETAANGITELSRAGATAVEVFLAHPPHIDVTKPEQIAAVRVAFEETGLRPFSGHCSFGDAADLSHLDAKARGASVERHLLEMRAAAKLGIEVVVVHPGVHCEEGKRAERLAAAADGMASIMPLAEELDLKVAFENLPPGYVGDTAEELVALVDGLDSPRAGFCLDTGHCHMTKVPVEDMVRAFGERIYDIHWQDNDGSDDQHEMPGIGTIDWPPFFEALEEIGFDGAVCPEVHVRGMLLPEFVRVGQLALDEGRAMFV